MKPRSPTAAHYKLYLRLHHLAGDDEAEFLRRYATALAMEKQKPRQRRKRTTAEFSLIALEILCRTLTQQGATRTKAIRQLVRDMQIKLRRGNEDSTVKHLRNELGKPDFQRRFREKVQVVTYPRKGV